MKRFDLDRDNYWVEHPEGDWVSFEHVKEYVRELQERMHKAEMERSDLCKQVAQLNKEKDEAYRERNKLVAALSRLYPSALGLHEEDPNWDKEWRNIVFINTPHGQLSWHIHDSELPLFKHLESSREWKPIWDGHSTVEKYMRLRHVSAKDFAPENFERDLDNLKMLYKTLISQLEAERDEAVSRRQTCSDHHH